MSDFEPFVCKSCGATNAEPGTSASRCDFCGAAAPVVKRPPPPPIVAAPRVVEDDSVGVSGSGWVCRQCRTYSSIPRTELPGSTGVEVLLWLLYIIPGVLYSMWRRDDKNAVKVCGSCNGNDLTPVSSPEGRSLFERKYGRRPRFD